MSIFLAYYTTGVLGGGERLKTALQRGRRPILIWKSRFFCLLLYPESETKMTVIK